ncbi:hypothetical protein Btru_005463 [Bulinus truncatus]|nr:hypothetical protein Btru_005463 [Bulinus truncatus]
MKKNAIQMNNSGASYNFILDPVVVRSILTVNLLFLAFIVGIFGIVANIVNIIVFRRLGYQDGVNVTLTALAVSDIGALVTQQVTDNFIDPCAVETDYIMLKTHLFALMVFVHAYFIRASGFITLFAAFERFLCVVTPLKFKTMVTANGAKVVNLVVFIVCSLYFVPLCLVVYVDWRFLPELNKTILSLYFRDNRDRVMRRFYLVADTLIPIAVISLLILFTSIIIVKLKAQSKWRQTNIMSKGDHPSNVLSPKQRRTVQMLTVVSIIFIVCFVPYSILQTALVIFREMKIGGVYFYVYYVSYSFCTLMEVVCCSVSIFIYYKMSTRFREECSVLILSAKKKILLRWSRK